jgi:hypothetical protein
MLDLRMPKSGTVRCLRTPLSVAIGIYPFWL